MHKHYDNTLKLSGSMVTQVYEYEILCDILKI